MIDLVLIPAAVLVASIGLLRLVERFARERAILDIPNVRSSHSTPTPRGGGVAIVLASLGGWVAAALTDGTFSVAGAAPACAALLIAWVGWRDDVKSLSVRVRFAAQSTAAIAVIVALGAMRALDVPFVGIVHLGWIGSALTFIWIVGLTNAYNFMDGIDGIAGAQGVACSLTWAVIATMAGDRVLSVFSVSAALACGVFLTRNWAPARIFMGDVGSAFLGFAFATMPLVALRDGAELPPERLPWIAVAAVWPFVFDASFTVIRRARRSERVTEAHRSHLYQRLVACGYSHRRVSALYAAWAAVCGCVAIAWTRVAPSMYWVLLSVIGLSAVFVWRLVVGAETRRTA